MPPPSTARASRAATKRSKREDDHKLHDQNYKVLEVVDGKLQEKEVPMLNALNEVLRDDYIKDSNAGVGRWNKVMEKAGIDFRLTVPHKAFNRQIGALAGVRVSPDGRPVSEQEWLPGKRVAGRRRRPQLCRIADEAMPGARQVRRLDCAPRHGHQSPARGLRVREVWVTLSRYAASPGDDILAAGGSCWHFRLGCPGLENKMSTITLIENGILKQHLIDPEICIRCNTCEATCPVDAITHDDNNYVVMADKCNGCMDCISPCPTGSIDNWRLVPASKPYSVAEQLGWESLPEELCADVLTAAQTAENAGDVQDLSQAQAVIAAARSGRRRRCASLSRSQLWRHHAALVCRPCLHQSAWSQAPVTATVVGNLNCTEAGFDNGSTISCWTSAPCLSRCSKASRWALSARCGCRRQAPCGASTRLPAPAMASAPATTIWH
jgi:ferredoxin